MAGLVYKAGLAQQDVVRKETGELIKTLVRISPPAEPDKTRQQIVAQVYSVMGALNHDILPRENKILGGSNSIVWYAWDSQFLYGVAPENDMTKASVADLKKVFLQSKISGSRPGRQIVDFAHPRKNQRVIITQKVITTVKQRQKLIDYFWRHVGRLKAGWLVAVGNQIVTLTGANQPPKWVTRHIAGAHGTAVDQTNAPDFPSITISNYSAGIGNRKNNLTYLVRSALSIRIKAMAKNCTLFVRGKKNLSDYR